MLGDPHQITMCKIYAGAKKDTVINELVKLAFRIWTNTGYNLFIATV